jgi:hypothetical protein
MPISALAYVALGEMVKSYPYLIVTLQSVFLLQLVRLGHISISICLSVLLSDHLRNPPITSAGECLIALYWSLIDKYYF